MHRERRATKVTKSNKKKNASRTLGDRSVAPP